MGIMVYHVSSLYTASFGSNLSSLKVWNGVRPLCLCSWAAMCLTYWQKSCIWQLMAKVFKAAVVKHLYFVLMTLVMKQKWVQWQTLIPILAYCLNDDCDPYDTVKLPGWACGMAAPNDWWLFSCTVQPEKLYTYTLNTEYESSMKQKYTALHTKCSKKKKTGTSETKNILQTLRVIRMVQHNYSNKKGVTYTFLSAIPISLNFVHVSQSCRLTFIVHESTISCTCN